MGGQIKPSIELKQQQIRAGLGGWGVGGRREVLPSDVCLSLFICGCSRLFVFVPAVCTVYVYIRDRTMTTDLLNTPAMFVTPRFDVGLCLKQGRERWRCVLRAQFVLTFCVMPCGGVKKLRRVFVFFFLKVATKIRPSWREFVNGMFLRAQLPCMKEAVFPASAVWIWCKLN